MASDPAAAGHPAEATDPAGATDSAGANHPAEATDPAGASDPNEATAAAGADHPVEASDPAVASHPVRARGRWWPRFRLVPPLGIREAVPAWLRWVLGTVPIAAILGLWWLVTGSGAAEERIISPTILPSPLEVARSFPSLWFDRALSRNVLVSLGRVLSGFTVGVAVAFPLGVLMGSFTKVKAMFNPLAVLGAYMPIPALVPLTLSLFGTGETQKVAFLAMAFAIYLLPLIVAAVDDVSDVFLKTAYTLGASTWQAVTKVLLAISWPDIFQALRFGFGVGWSYILLAEMVDIGRGIGGIIIVSQRRGPREHIYLVLIVIVALAFATDKLWAYIGRRLFPYRDARR